MALIVDIEKTLGDFHLKVNFTAEREVMALLGVSGCGKSMTLGCIAGIVRPDKGHIELNGARPVRQRKENRPAAAKEKGRLPVSAVRAVSTHDGRAEHPRRRARRPKAEREQAVREVLPRVPPGGTGEQPSESAFRWSAAAVRDGAHSGRAA